MTVTILTEVIQMAQCWYQAQNECYEQRTASKIIKQKQLFLGFGQKMLIDKNYSTCRKYSTNYKVPLKGCGMKHWLIMIKFNIGKTLVKNNRHMYDNAVQCFLEIVCTSRSVFSIFLECIMSEALVDNKGTVN